VNKIINSIQLIFIVILAIALILSLIFRPSKPIDTYENEINALKEQNTQLLLSNDSINSINSKLQKEINTILYAIDSTKVVLKETETKLAELEKKRNEIPNIISNMDSDDITSSISDYLKRRSKGDN
jgi:chromosome segregation ATPase